MTDNIKSIRSRIDALDQRLVKLLSARARLAQRIGKVKAGRGLPSRARSAGAARRPRSNPGPLSGRGARAPVHRDHVGVPRAGGLADGRLSRPAGHLQPGSRAQAFRRACGHWCRAARSTRSSARSRPARSATRVVPVENSTEGAIGRTLDLLLATPVEDLRRGDAADPPVPDEQGTASSAASARSTRTRRASRSASSGSRAALPQAERVAGREQRRSGAAGGAGAPRGGDRPEDRGGALPAESPRAQHRGRSRRTRRASSCSRSTTRRLPAATRLRSSCRRATCPARCTSC